MGLIFSGDELELVGLVNALVDALILDKYVPGGSTLEMGKLAISGTAA